MNTKSTYCYCRVSKDSQSEQKGGYGMSRQQSLLMEYVEGYQDKNGLGYKLSIDDTTFLRAEGVSAFSGKNIEKGSVLMNFIDDVKSGIIKNAVLLIENIDRFSRMNPNEATELFLSLINSGCDIHECDIGLIHHKKSDTTLISAGLSRSHKESERKQKLSIKNWDKRFKAFEKKEAALTAKSPAWLKVNEKKEYEVIESEVVVYRKIFQLYSEGYGQAYIRDYLNDNEMKVNNRTVGTWMIHKILTDERLVGKVRVKSKLREQYKGLQLYPMVIDEVTFNKAQLLLKSKTRGQKINRKANNLFAGVAKCGVCRDSHLVVHFDGRQSYYRCGCSIQKNKRCKAAGFKYDVLEMAVVNNIRNFEPVYLKNDNKKEEIEKLNLELINLIIYRDEVQSDIDKARIPDPSDRRILKNIQHDISEMEIKIDHLRSINNVKNEISDISKYITDEIFNTKNVELRKQFNVKIRRIVKNIYALKIDNVITICLEYFIDNAEQWIRIDSRSGGLIFDAYSGKGNLELDLGDVGIFIFDKNTKKYIHQGEELSNEEFIKLLDSKKRS